MASEDQSINKGPVQEEVKTTPVDSGKMAIDQVIANEQPQTSSPSLAPTTVGQEHSLRPPIEGGVPAVSLNAVFMQPNYEGKFFFTNKDYIRVLGEDETIRSVSLTERVLPSSPAEQAAAQTAFAHLNLPQGLMVGSGADLAFDKLYFGQNAAYGINSNDVGNFYGNGQLSTGAAIIPVPGVSPGAVVAAGGGAAPAAAAATAEVVVNQAVPATVTPEAIAEAANPVVETTTAPTAPITVMPSVADTTISAATAKPILPVIVSTTSGTPPISAPPSNTAPIALSDTFVMNEDTVLLFNTQDILRLVSDREGDAVSLISLNSSSGTLVNNGNGIWSFSAGANFNGNLSLTYIVSDGKAFSSQTILVQVMPVNDAPVVTAVDYLIAKNSTLTINENVLLAHASDVDNDALSVAFINSAQGALVNNHNGTWSFTPANNFSGVTDLNFGISDGSVTTQNVIHVNVANDTAPVGVDKTFNILEDNSLTITSANLLAGATDVDGDTLSVVAVSYAGNNGILVDNHNGTWTFTPNQDFNGAVDLSYNISDGQLTTSNNIHVNIAPVNDAPVSVAKTFNILEDNSLTITSANLLAGATDVDGDTLSVTAVSYAGNNGTLVDNHDGTWTFTPNQDFNGAVDLSYTISDGALASSNNIHVNIAPVNDAPVGVDKTYTIQEDSSLTITSANLLSGATDVDGDTLSVVAVNYAGSDGVLVDNHNGTWTFSPAANFNGAVNLSYTISDGSLIDTNNIHINVSSVNNAPVGVDKTFNILEDNSLTITSANLLAGATDVDGDTLSVTAVSYTGNSGVLVDNHDGTWTFTPNQDFNGSVDLSYTISDGSLDTTNNIHVNIAPVNDAPVSVAKTFNILEDNSLTITSANLLAGATDVDGDTLSVTAVTYTGNNGVLVDNHNGTWTFTPAQDFNGAVDLSYTISDGSLTSSNNIHVNIAPVNDAPVSVAKTFNILEDNSLTITSANLLAGATDVDGDTLSVTAVSYTGNSGVLVDNHDGTWTFTPNQDFNGSVDLSYTISDGSLTSNNNIHVNIAPVNDAPVSIAKTFNILEDNSLTITSANLLAGATDVDGDTLSVTAVSYAGNNGVLVDNHNGTWTFTPNQDFNGSVDLSYTISDGALTSSSNIHVNIAPVNDAPVSIAKTFNILEDNSLTITSANLLAGATDVDGDTLSVTAVIYSGNNGVLVDNHNGTWTFTPNQDFNGSVDLSYTISDGALTSSSNIHVNITPVNDAPVSIAKTFNISEDNSLTITSANLLAGATDVDGDTLSVTAVSYAGNNGVLVDNHNGTWTFTPNQDFNGAVDLSYTISDGALTSSNNIHVNIAPVNDAPVSIAKTFNILEDNSLTITSANLLAGATDVDGDTLSVTAVTYAGNNGVLVDNHNGTWTFTPAANFNGAVDLNYTISDGSLTTSNNIHVNIAPVNDAPVSIAKTFNILEDNSLTITSANLLAGATDVDGDTLSVTAVTYAGNNGVLVDNHNGTWTFTPAANFNGAVDLSYTISDGALTSSSNIHVNIAPVNDAPVVTNFSYSMNEDRTLIIKESDILAHASDVDGDTLSIVNITSAQGTLQYNGNHTWSFAPPANFNGSLNITVALSDGTATANVPVAVTVLPVNDAPVVNVPATFNATEDTNLVITQAQLLTGASDVDGNTLTVTSVTVPVGQGTISGSSGGPWTFTPAANFNGAVKLTFTTSDGTVSVSQTANVNVAAVNDAPVVGAPSVSYSMAEDGSIVIKASDLLANASDVDANTLSITNITSAQGVLTNNGNGIWTFTPNANYNGTATLTYTVSDGTTTVNQNFPVTVTAVNDAPVVLSPSAYSVNENAASLQITQASLITNTTDVDGNALTVTAVSVPAAQGTISGVSGGPWTFVPAANFNGAATLTFTVSDGTVSTNGSATINVIPSGNDTITQLTSTPLYTGAGVDNITVGTTFTSGAGNTNTTVFNINAGDGNDTVLVQAHDVASTFNLGAGDDTITTTSNKAIIVDGGAGNDNITGGSAVDTLVGGAGNDIISGGGGGDDITGGAGDDQIDGGAGSGDTVYFTGNRNEYVVAYNAGTDTYTVTDLVANRDGVDTVVNVENFKFGATNFTATQVKVDVDNVPAVPPAVLPSMNEDTSITITKDQLLSNTPPAVAVDADGTAMNILNNTLTLGAGTTGTIVYNGNNTWTFTPSANFNGTANLNFTVTDGVNNYAQVASTNVLAVNDAPTAGAPSTLSVVEDGGLIITKAQLLDGATDIDGNTLNISTVTVPVNQGTVTSNGNGTWTFVPAANFNGTATLTIGVSDGIATTNQNMSVTVTAVNDAPVVNAPTAFNATEDTNLVITQAQLLANASDVDGNTLTVTSVTAPVGQGTISGSAGGPWTFTPAANFNGPVKLTFTTSDGTVSVSQTATVNIAAVNDTPVVPAPTPMTIEEEGSLVVYSSDLLANATDADGNTLTVTNLTTSNGALINNGNGSWTFVPATNFFGTANLQFTVSDGTASVVQTLQVNVTNVYDPITVPVVNMNMVEDTTLTINENALLANVVNPDNAVLSIANITSPQGTLINNHNGTWSFTPAHDFDGAVNLQFSVNDGTNTFNQTLHIDVANNDPPVVQPVNLSVAEDTTIVITASQLLAAASDVDGDTLSISNVSAATGTLVNNGNGTWSYTPAANFNGAVQLHFTITDGYGFTTQDINLNVTPVNDAPVVTPFHLGMLEDGTLLISASQLLAHATDVDGDSLSIASLTAPQGNLVNNGDGTWSFTPAANFNGSLNLQFSVTDGHVTVPQNVIVDIAPVNDAPIVPNVNLNILEDQTLLLNAQNLLSGASDIDGDSLTITNVSSQFGTIVNNGNGTWSFTPPANFNGDLGLSFTVSDGTVSVVRSADVSIAAVNDAPTAVGQINYLMNEDSTLLISGANILANLTDVEGDHITISNLTATNGTIIDNGDGTWSFTPAQNFSGTLKLEYTASDGMDSSIQTINIAVKPINDAPIVAAPPAFTTLEDNSLIIKQADLLVNASDPDSDSLSVTNVTVPANQGTIVYSGNGFWTFTPAANYNGSATLTFTTSDGHVSVNQSATVNVTAVNDAPVVNVPATFNATEDTNLIITQAQLLASASDVDLNSLTVTSVTVPVGQGTISGSSGGPWTFTPAANFNGAVKLTFTTSDGTVSVSQTANVNVAAVNDAPVVGAPSVSYSMAEDGSIVIKASDLLANASDVDANTLSITNITSAQGVLTNNGNGIWTFTPNANYNGTATLTYTVSDGTTTVNQNFPVTVTAVNDAPAVLSPSAYSVNENAASLQITQASLITNTTDVDGNALTVTAVSVPAAQGTISGVSGGPWTFVPAANFNGSATLTFTVSDGTVAVNGSATVNVVPSGPDVVVQLTSTPLYTGAGIDTITVGSLNTSGTGNTNTVDFNINAGDGNDIVTLQAHGSGTVVNLGAGDDTLTQTVGNVKVTVDGGAGNDTITTAGGADTILGGAGNDIINSGSGGDDITGGAGNDQIDGGVGSDTVYFAGNRNEYVVAYDSLTDTYTVTDLVANRDGVDTIKNVESFKFYNNNPNGTTTNFTANTIKTDVDNYPVVPPVALPNMNEDTSITITKAQLLSNATVDADGTTMNIYNNTVTLGAGTTGTIIYNGNNTWTFTPSANFNGTANLNFTVSDGVVANNYPQVASVSVLPVNDAPAAGAPSTLSVVEDGGLIITKAQLLDGATDIDGDTLNISTVTVPVNQGTVTANGNGTWTFVPAANFNGTATLTIGVSDGTATVNQNMSVTVTAVNDAPVVNAPAAITFTGAAPSMSITQAQLIGGGNATDVDGNTLTVTSVSVPAAQGTITGSAGGPWTFTPSSTFSGAATLTFTTSDGTVSVNQNATVNVTKYNYAPVGSAPFAFNMVENGAIIISAATLLSHITDANADSLSITNISVDHGSLTANSNGTWTYVPSSDYNGTVALQYTTSDGQANVVQNATINVAAETDDLKFHVNDLNITGSGHYTAGDGSIVDATYTSLDNAAVTMQHEAASGISSVDVTANNASQVTVNDFDHAKVTLGSGGNNGGASGVDVSDATSGDITTGSGNDQITITTADHIDNTDNLFNIHSGAGADHINVFGNNLDDQARFTIDTGSGNDTVELQGKYASADIKAGAGDDVITGGQGNDTLHVDLGSGHDTFNAGTGWADTILIDSSSGVSITANGANSWTLMVDGQQATLTANGTGVIDNAGHALHFDASASGTLTMADGSSVDFSNVEHVQW